MATLSQSQIQMYAAAAGMSNPPLMAAIAMAESSGSTTVVNSIGCVGLWQINQPVWVKSHPTWTKTWLQNPANNASAAALILSSQGLNAWEAYTNGAYEKYYSGSASTDSTTEQTLSINPYQEGQNLGNDFTEGWKYIFSQIPGLKGVGSTFDILSWLTVPKNLLRLGYVVGGGLMVLMALDQLAKPVTKPLTQNAMKIAKVIK